MTFVKPKKFLGQHFLLDEQISQNIAGQVLAEGSPFRILEVGAGTGALTKYLFQDKKFLTQVIDIDSESIAYLKKTYPEHQANIIFQDVLSADFRDIFNQESDKKSVEFSIVGNFPYNISSQILFRVLKHKQLIPLMVGMFQKEVALRIASNHGNKTYGILSVLMQTFYDVNYLFEVPPEAFQPPPKVTSAVLRFTLRKNKTLSCSESVLFQTVKIAFNQRRKTLRNALKKFLPDSFDKENSLLNKRAEELSPADFEMLACMIEKA